MTELLIYGVVGDTFDGLDAKTLVPLFSEGEGDLVLRINSPGGYVFEGLAIYNALVALERKVVVHIDGLAASMASVIAMAGDEIVMADNALFMIHNPWDVAVGDGPTMRKKADQLDKVKDQLIGIYAKRSGMEAADLSALMDAETWYDAKEALAAKFITSIGEAIKTSACDVSKFGFRKVPDSPAITKAIAETFDVAAVLQGISSAVAAVLQPKENAMSNPDTQAADTKPADAAEIQAATQAAIVAERTRASTIRATVEKAKLDATFAQELIDAGTSVDEARVKIIDKIAELAPTITNYGPAVVTQDARDKFREGAVNSLLVRFGHAAVVEKAAALSGNKVRIDAGEFRGFTNADLARESLRVAGIRGDFRTSDQAVRAAITQTQSDFPTLLETAMHKVLLAAYATAPHSWNRFCGIGSVTDFRAHNRYRKGSFGALDSLNEAGEYKRKSIPDGEKESITASTKGNIINLSRQAIVNDDMDAFFGLAADLGMAAQLSIETDVFALLALASAAGPTMSDGVTLFHASHANIGTAGAPSVTAFDDARVKMGSQTDPSGNQYLALRPAVWLGPLSLLGTATVVNNAVYDPDTANKLQKPNMVQAMFDDMVGTPRLTGTRWYAFADPATNPAIQVAFLNGEREPVVETRDGWNVDGTEWKVRHDYGVGAIDYRTALTNAGA